MSELLGSVIGNCRLEALIGSGSMGQVFRARHIHLDRLQAIKILHRNVAGDPNFQQRFRQEARALADLEHPQIVRLYECGEDAGYFFISMELMSDGALRTLLERRRRSSQSWPLVFSLDLALQATEALSFAHGRKILHRDLKPENLLLARSTAPGSEGARYALKVGDFGLAQVAEGSGLTASGMTVGTPTYMSPEQCQGFDIDGRSDMYSLGVVVYEMLAGIPPFTGERISEVAHKHVKAQPRSLREIAPQLPPAVDALVMRCLAKEPNQRYPDARALADELRGLIAEQMRRSAPATPLRVRVKDSQGHTLQLINLPPDGLTVGRLVSNAIVLDEPAILRSHLRISRGVTRARVIDLGSRSGTTIDHNALVPHTEHPWAIGQVVRLGSYSLELEPATAALVRLNLPPEQAVITLNPHQTTLLSLIATNMGAEPEQISLSLSGFPREQVQLPEQPLRLEPESNVTLMVPISLAGAEQLAAGPHQVQIGAYRAGTSDLLSAVGNTWHVPPRIDGLLHVAPSEISAPVEGVYSIRLSNCGNLPTTYQLSLQIPEKDIQATLTHDKVEVAPGATTEIGLTIRVARRILGVKRRYSITVCATADQFTCRAEAHFVQKGPLLF